MSIQAWRKVGFFGKLFILLSTSLQLFIILPVQGELSRAEIDRVYSVIDVSNANLDLVITKLFPSELDPAIVGDENYLAALKAAANTGFDEVLQNKLSKARLEVSVVI